MAWGIVSLRSAGNQPDTPAPFMTQEAAIGSAAFLVASGSEHELVVHTPGRDNSLRTITTFERNPNVESGPRGQASPMGNRIAMVLPAANPHARIGIISIDDGSGVESPALVDANTTIAWRPDGTAFIAASSLQADESGQSNTSLLHINASTGVTRVMTTFERAFRVAPIGFNLDGTRLFVVVVDQAGSSLWTVEDGEANRVAPLSSGRTRDWALSPEGNMLAYIEVRSGASTPTVGRAVFTATGAPVQVTDTTSTQEGVAWRPGHPLPGFGGPGGTLQIEEPGADSTAYLVPESWSPDGTALVARVVVPAESDGTPSTRWELLKSPTTSATTTATSTSTAEPARTVLFDESVEVRFLGWLTDTAISTRVRE